VPSLKLHKCRANPTPPTAADEATVAPAVAQVDPTSSNSTAPLSSAETIQLTDAVLANLTNLDLSNISLFGFGDDTAGAVAKRSNCATAKCDCKTYPGDLLWPAPIIWKVFDLLLGGALIKTVPYASPCYSDFKNKNTAKCDLITANWVNNSYMQYVAQLATP